ncbi:hypothetical protein [Sphingomonas qomolangmaensis]|uniref:Uncharacterized protein n=1 Tax=Sphingomonas qomolangmaensis TaxID=2918765 RepID=A0ABY5LBP9_9SPHN|nr:hypothetical protein [Sphingomonas qomolangmaensis]UUL82111.1 hypothetical protein NMP03_13095 [Sphingomonas qomolangmaensis]
MNRALAVAQRLGAARARVVADAVAVLLQEAMPDGAVTLEDEGVVIEARGGLMRAATDPALRWVAGGLR